MKISATARRAFRFVALAGVLVGLAVTPAAATNGQPIVAAQANTETTDTIVQNTAFFPAACPPDGNDGLIGCGGNGLVGRGTVNGVTGEVTAGEGAGVLGVGSGAGQTGVDGVGETGVDGASDAQGGTGVLGESLNTSSGIGVQGDSEGTGSGVYGLAKTNGVGVFGDTTNGTGVIARSTNGTALDVRGKATFSRSGTVTVAAATTSKKVTLAGVTSASMILATAQQDSAVSVRSAVPASDSFTIHLTGKAPPGGLKVAYFVLN